MTYAIHASRNGQSVVTVRISPIAAVDKARLLERWNGECILQTQPGTSSTPETLIDFCSWLPKLETGPMRCD